MPSLIDLLVVGMEQPWAAAMLSGFGHLAAGRGLDLVPSPSEPTVPDEALTRILARGSRGPRRRVRARSIRGTPACRCARGAR